MEIFDWQDRRTRRAPRAVIQQGRCESDQCGQFSISISNGDRGMTVRFDSEAESCEFLEQGAVEKRSWPFLRSARTAALTDST
jgi:hypothetical protein